MTQHSSRFRISSVCKGLGIPVFRRIIHSVPAILLLATLLPQSGFSDSGACGYAVATSFVPVFNTALIPEIFGSTDGKSPQLDCCGQIRALEFIAFPGTAFRIESVVENRTFPVYRITTEDYPYKSRNGFYVDGRLVKKADTQPPRRALGLPPREKVLSNLISAHGSSYVWGGNRRTGIPEMLALYPVPPGFELSRISRDRWILRGLDCSGLLYEATDGFTPRNTSSLTRYGAPVQIAGLDAEEISARIKSLDLIVWNGHVMIALDGERVIESRLDCKGEKGGVIIRSLREALKGVLAGRVPVNEYDCSGENVPKCFVVRRWYPE